MVRASMHSKECVSDSKKIKWKKAHMYISSDILSIHSDCTGSVDSKVG